MPWRNCYPTYRRLLISYKGMASRHNAYDTQKTHRYDYDAVAFAHDNGIQRPNAMIREVADALRQFRPVAGKNSVGTKWIGRVESTILDHLRAWGEYGEPADTVSSEVNGHKISDIKIEQTYKGNYHLLANIDGEERKFVIGKNKKEYAEIEKTGIANITYEQLFEMAKTFFSSTLEIR